VRRVSREDGRDQVAGGALPFRPGYADAPSVAEEAKCPLWLTDQETAARAVLTDEGHRSRGKGAEIALNGGANRRKSERDGGAMDDKIRSSEERRQILGIAKRGVNGPASERFCGTDHPLDRVRIVHGHVRTSCGGKRGSRLACSTASKDDDVATAQTPRSNGWRLKVV
jgi:hypothetical protein